MMIAPQSESREKAPLADLLSHYSIEVTSRDLQSLESITATLPQGCEVFVAHLPKEDIGLLVRASAGLRDAGFVPVPHIVARNISNRLELDTMLARLSEEAGVRNALVLGGDRDDAAGAFGSSLDLINTGLFQTYGIGRIAIACYPEGHPRIASAVLDAALTAKVDAAARAGLDVLLVSQFLFDPKPLLNFARRLRERGVTAPLSVGIAGPASRTKLLKYALRCGVGASLRALRERSEIARNVLSGETPEELLMEIAAAQTAEPDLGISGVHFFTFGDPAQSIRWAEQQVDR
ncbi:MULTISPECIES: methylenetetrahydrofolate reductase [Rhizobium]|uniref:methylenetetrahydrofolate reductase n=1 Tax=Rhizobium TaxID=379 RepID=UPI00037B9D84|nr:methylenetetrahydrofolate reductase [Rhizobium leguminosarum]ASR12019.1 methylenetetrahydrofolate reductase [Rhizobium leguminosarum bv. viciae]MBY5773442.1 methylenetetrahydrofolate reductase [Rhizobium leguminosarum]MBY5781696.1 methylenetetrahydrofolate reductase [Rhizobium leguminosarum]MBY5787992.1 methylenetetrahydrofolate reductase [Rhizobium leguminosarum]MBY5801035.1 methylenetetrahydrofolate reductase [Rhizobium leguminosarum]